MTKLAKIDTSFMAKKGYKNTLLGLKYLYSLYKGVPTGNEGQ